MKNIRLFSGTSNYPLAKEISDILNIELSEIQIERFSDGEIRVQILESIRGKDVFFIQSTSAPANDNIMELLLVTDAMRRAAAGQIITLIPYFGYARQDRKDKPRVPISAKLMANLLTIAGVSRVVAVDLHAGQIQGFFDIPLDHIYAASVLIKYFKQLNVENPIIVSPDAGGVERARYIAKKLGYKMAIIDKRREEVNQAEVMNVIGDVKEKTAIIVDDMVDTAGTLIKGCNALQERGIKAVYFGATHAVLSGNAYKKINNCEILKKVIVTNTIFKRDAEKCQKLEILSLAPLLAHAIEKIQKKESISVLFEA